MTPPLQTWRLPDQGVLRVHRDPTALPRYEGVVGPSRFDDPRPDSLLRGCLIELMDWLRPNVEAAEREAAVVDAAPSTVSPTDSGRAFSDYLRGRSVGTITARDAVVVSIDDPALQAELDKATAVRALLDSPDGRAALLPAGAAPSRRAHLDEAAVRLSSDLGRELTRACSLALRDRESRPDGIHYRSRHDDAEDCWALYDHANVSITVQPLTPKNRAHRDAVQGVADMWDLALPRDWR